MYEIGDADTSLHLKISKWHSAYNILDCDHQFKEASIGKLLMPSQRLLWEIDPGPEDSREIASVRHELWAVMADYKRLMKDKDVSYKKKKLLELLDLYSSAITLSIRQKAGVSLIESALCVQRLRD